MGRLWRFVIRNEDGTMTAVLTLFAADASDAEEWALDFVREGLVITPLKEFTSIKYVNSSENKL